MKTLTTLSIAVIAALFIGCGSGSDGSSSGNSGVTDGTTNSTPSGSTSSQGSQGYIQFDARNLSGNTVFVEDKDGVSISDKEHIFIFETGTQVKIIVNRNDGGQVVYEGTYKLKDDIASLYVVDMNSITGDSSSTSFTLFLEDNYTIKENQLGTYVTQILPNESNGVVIKDNTPTADGLTIRSVDDVKGYTITSNLSRPGTSGMTMEMSIAVKCDGTFNYMVDIAYAGNHSVNNYDGNEVYVDEQFGVTRVGWYYTDEDGERSAGQIETDINNQLLKDACWSGTNSDGTCSNDIKIKSITGSGC